MNLSEFVANGLLDAFAGVIRTRQNANIILESIGFPASGRPNFPRDGADRSNYWLSIGQDIESGVLERGTDLQPLVNAAWRRYPTNPVLRRFQTQASSDPSSPRVPNRDPPSTSSDQEVQSPDATSGATASASDVPGATAAGSNRARPVHVSLLIQGWDDVNGLLDAARDRTAGLGMPRESVELGFASAEGIVLQLNGWTMQRGHQLGQSLSTAHAGNSAIQASVATTDFQDYLIGRLNVEGPDQRQFEILDIPASTRVGDVGQGIIAEEYSDQKLFEKGGAGSRREVVVDRVHSDGTTERLDPDKNLHEQNVHEDDNLSVSPESTAGSVNPVVRESALVRVRNEVLDFAESHPGFKVGANSSIAPTEYIFQFRAPSFGPPPIPGANPVEIDDHEVFVFLPADFPMVAPQVYWQRPIIFHPNVHPEKGAVCLGALADRYLPGLSFGMLCQLLIDIAGFQNYAVEEGYNLEAQEWAFSQQGQAAIEQRGGKSFLRMVLHKIHQPRRLWIRPVAE